MSEILRPEAIRLGLTAADRTDAIVQCGQVLLEIGAVREEYIAAMREREHGVSTFVGRGVAIPHGNAQSQQYVRCTALAVLQFPGGVDWGGDRVSLCVAIAADGEEHVRLMSGLAQLLRDERQINRLHAAADPDTVLELLGRGSAPPVDEVGPVRSTAPTVRRPNPALFSRAPGLAPPTYP